MTRTIPLTASDFETGLNEQVTAGDTTAQLISIVDTDGNNLANGLYGFTIDGDVPESKEYIIATLTSSALSGVISVTDQGVATNGFQKFHRRGASIAITDWVVLSRIVNVLTGVTPLDGTTPLQYDSAPALGSSTQLATVQYVLDHINGGAISFNSEVVNGTAGETIASGDWVYLKAADGRWYKTDATDATKSVNVTIGKARAASTAGNAIAGGVFISGQETIGSYTSAATYYLSNTPGTVATSAGTNSVIVGVGDATSKLLFDANHGNTPSAGEKAALAGTYGTPSSANKFLTGQSSYTTETDQSQTTQNASSAVGQANTTTLRNKVAQSFIPTVISARGMKLWKLADTGSFAGTVTVSLQADSAGSPSGTDLASAVLTNAQWLRIAAGEFPAFFATEYDSMVIGSTYWIVVTTSTSDTSNCPNIGISSTNLYANGVLKYNNTTDGWVTTAVDLYFKTIEGVTNRIAGLDTNGRVPVSVSQEIIAAFDTTQSAQVVNGAGVVTAFSATLPAGFFSTKSGLRIRVDGALFTNTTSFTSTITILLNGITLYSESLNAATTTTVLSLITSILNNGSLSSQKYFVDRFANNSFTPATGGNLTSSIDTSGETSIQVQIQSNATLTSSGYAQYNRCVIERIAQ